MWITFNAINSKYINTNEVIYFTAYKPNLHIRFYYIKDYTTVEFDSEEKFTNALNTLTTLLDITTITDTVTL